VQKMLPSAAKRRWLKKAVRQTVFEQHVVLL
jgi:hypothetical protein